MEDDYQFEDAESAPVGDGAEASSSSRPAREPRREGGGGEGGGRFADEIFSVKIQAKFRTFFVDLKESSNGKFIKVSEKSHGRKSTIMMDAEDVPEVIAALQEVQKHL